LASSVNRQRLSRVIQATFQRLPQMQIAQIVKCDLPQIAATG